VRKFHSVMVLAAVAAGTLAPLVVGPAQAAPQRQSFTMPRAAGCAGVWVVVDLGSLGGVSTRCASSFATGLAALRSAGFAPTVEDGFVYKISGKPSKPDINKAYWSYWHATKQSDGSYSAWSYSNQGGGRYQPKQGNAEGWRYLSVSDPRTPPGAKPPVVEAPSPTPSKTTAKPTPKPTPKPSRTTAKPTKSATPTRSATPTPTTNTRSATTSVTRSASAGATASSRPARDRSSGTAATPAAATPADSTRTPFDDAPSTSGTEVAQEQPSVAADSANGSGSPLGAIVVGSVVVAAAAGLGGWWMLKGRRS